MVLTLSQSGTWEMWLNTNQGGRFGGGVVDIGKASVDAQFGFDSGVAMREISAAEIPLIKAGREFGVQINGDGPMKYWSLTGSTAAMLKAEECGQRPGQSRGALAACPDQAAGQHAGHPVRHGQRRKRDRQLQDGLYPDVSLHLYRRGAGRGL
ncbi:hypothetical protein [Tropicibacter naphthalenivorans]|uniref:hypothetical protein n=1 Tax=Tropicibacter naphthalenivorans TaxID=441103 RepID=UPI00117FDC3B|nr:hypothetical protein [Tropicibacter naphthalenivorans]